MFNKVLFGVVESLNNVTTARPVSADMATRTLQGIDFAHHMVHIGQSFYAIASATLAGTDVLGFSFTAPALTTAYTHMCVSFRGSTAGTGSILENVTSFTGGTAYTAINLNRNSTVASGSTILWGKTGTTPLVPTGGTEIFPCYVSSGVTNGFDRAAQIEIILKPSIKYHFGFTNGASSSQATVYLYWYEMIPLN